MEFHLYRGFVVDNNDTTQSGRVKVRLFELHGIQKQEANGAPKADYVEDSELPWAEVMQPIDFVGFSTVQKSPVDTFSKSINGQGSKSAAQTVTYDSRNPGTGYNRILAIGTWVFAILDNGNPNNPIVIGTIAAKKEYTKSKAERVYDSLKGHYEEFNDTTGEIIIHNKNGNELILGDDGAYLNSNYKLNVYSAQDMNVHTDTNYNFYAGANIKETLKGNVESTISGNQSYKITGNSEFKITGNYELNASQITVKGQSSVTIGDKPAMINISGSIINLN